MFAVTGITGKVGAAVARSLLAADQPVRAVIRDRSKGAAWARLGCDIAVVDMEDAAPLCNGIRRDGRRFRDAASCVRPGSWLSRGHAPY